MEAKARHVHIGDGPRRIEPRENVAQLFNMLCHYASRVVVFVKALQSLVAIERIIRHRNA
jgi:hypothetical protein